MPTIVEAATLMILLHTPGDPPHEISINPDKIIAMRDVGEGKVLTEDAKCALNTEDGKFISVIETCKHVRDEINRVEKQK